MLSRDYLLERLAAILIAVTLTVRSPIASWISIGSLIAVVLWPVVFNRLPVRASATLIILSAASALAGLILALQAVRDVPSRRISLDFMIFDSGTLVGLILIAIPAFWASKILGVRSFLIFWSIGYLPVAVLSTPLLTVNPWKFALALPITVLALSLAAKSTRAVLTALLLLAIVSVISGYRSWALGLLLAATLCIVLPRIDRIRSTSTASKLVLFVCIAAASAWLVFELVLGGLFGEGVRERTELQLRWGDGNIVLGGRSEWGAALAGFVYRPVGFGSGVSPAANDWAPIIAGQRVPEGLKDYTTVAQYMTAGRIEFHSTFWNFWSHYGLVGMLLIAYIGWVLVKSCLQAASTAKAISFVVAVLIVEILWNLFFSPTVIATLGVATGVALFNSHAVVERPPKLPAASG